MVVAFKYSNNKPIALYSLMRSWLFDNLQEYQSKRLETIWNKASLYRNSNIHVCIR